MRPSQGREESSILSTRTRRENTKYSQSAKQPFQPKAFSRTLEQMHIPKKYFQDRFILLLLSLNTFLALFASVLVLLRLDSGRSDGYIVQYRADQGLDAFSNGGVLEFLSFIIFVALVLGFHTVLSIKIYTARRHFATAILGLGLLLMIVTIIVSNALLELR